MMAQMPDFIQFNKSSLHRCIAYGGSWDMGPVDVVVFDMAASYWPFLKLYLVLYTVLFLHTVEQFALTSQICSLVDGIAMKT